MKRNKGFTLIELLAVLVILAIIALIITPIISGVIKDAREKAAKNATEGLLEAVHVYYGRQVMLNDGVFNDNKKQKIKFDGEPGGVSGKTVDGDVAIEFNGYTVTSGIITVDRDGNVTIDPKHPIVVNGYSCINGENGVTCIENGSQSETPLVNPNPSVYAKLCDEDNNGEAETLILNNNLDFTCSGTLVKNYNNQDNSVYQSSTTVTSPMWYGDRDKVITVTILNEIMPNTTFMYFSTMTNLTNINNIQNLNTTYVNKMAAMFLNDSSLTSLDVSNFDTSNVIDMSSMFGNTSSLTNIDVSNWDTSSVTNMGSMFSDARSLTNLDVSNWDTSSVTNMSFMFTRCLSLTNLDVSDWDTSSVTNMSSLFEDNVLLTNIDVSNWDTSNVTGMSRMFSGTVSLTSLDVSKFDTSNVTNMGLMFCSLPLTSLDVSSFDTSNVTNMSKMFGYNENLQTIYVGNSFDTSNVTSSSDMFFKCLNIRGGNGTTYDSRKKDKTYARVDKEGQPGYFTLKN